MQIRKATDLNINEPLQNFRDALLSVGEAPDDEVQRPLGEEVLMRRVVLPLAAEVPRPKHHLAVLPPNDEVADVDADRRDVFALVIGVLDVRVHSLGPVAAGRRRLAALLSPKLRQQRRLPDALDADEHQLHPVERRRFLVNGLQISEDRGGLLRLVAEQGVESHFHRTAREVEKPQLLHQSHLRRQLADIVVGYL